MINNNFMLQPKNITVLLGFDILITFSFAFIVINVKSNRCIGKEVLASVLD